MEQQIAQLLLADDTNSQLLGVRLMKTMKVPINTMATVVSNLGWKNYVIMYDDISVMNKEYVASTYRNSNKYSQKTKPRLYENITTSLTSSTLLFDYNYPLIGRKSSTYLIEELELSTDYLYTVSASFNKIYTDANFVEQIYNQTVSSITVFNEKEYKTQINKRLSVRRKIKTELYDMIKQHLQTQLKTI